MGRGVKYSAEALEIIRRAHKDGMKITTIVATNPDLKLTNVLKRKGVILNSLCNNAH